MDTVITIILRDKPPVVHRTQLEELTPYLRGLVVYFGIAHIASITVDRTRYTPGDLVELLGLDIPNGILFDNS